MFRIGIGYDIHKKSINRPLYLGGLKISEKNGLLGHSDADIIIHTICDSILGALSKGDIGERTVKPTFGKKAKIKTNITRINSNSSSKSN